MLRFFFAYLPRSLPPPPATAADFSCAHKYTSLSFVVGCVRVMWKSIFNLNPFFPSATCVCVRRLYVGGCGYVQFGRFAHFLLLLYFLLGNPLNNLRLFFVFRSRRSLFSHGIAKHITWTDRPPIYSSFILLLFIDSPPIPSINIQAILYP